MDYNKQYHEIKNLLSSRLSLQKEGIKATVKGADFKEFENADEVLEQLKEEDFITYDYQLEKVDYGSIKLV